MAQKKKPSVSENKKDELGEEETVLLGWNRLRREATPSVAVFPIPFLWSTSVMGEYKIV